MGLISNAEKSPPSQLKASMDLYEEIVTEEQQSRESSYTELNSRFQAAQNQIKELRRRLEQMEMQNSGLNTENYRLKKNISALLRTARQEVTRKDAEIQRLNQWPKKGQRPHLSRNYLQDQSSFNHTSIGCSMNRLHPPSSSSQPVPSSSPALPLPLTSSSRLDLIQNDHIQPSRKESDSSSNQPSGSCVEIKAPKISSNHHSRGSLSGDCQVPDKYAEISVSKSSVISSTQQSESDKHKSRHRDEKYQGQIVPESTERKHRTGSDAKGDCEKNRTHKSDKDTRRRYDSRSSKSGNYQNDVGHHRPEKASSPPPEVLKIAGSNDSEGRSRERRRHKSKRATLHSEHSTDHSSKEGHGRSYKKNNKDDRHKGSGSKDQKKNSSHQHAERRCDSSKDKELGRLSKDCHRKEDGQLEDAIIRKYKKKFEASRDHERLLSNESQYVQIDIHRKKKTHEILKRSTELITEKLFVDENSPNRKLCFMETLNLTLSPVKKPRLPNTARQNDLEAVEKALENGPDGEESQPDIEDMCVIDEVASIEIEAGMEDTEEQSPDITRTQSSDKKMHMLKDNREKNKNQSATSMTDKGLESSSVQTTSGMNQRLHSVGINLSAEAPESSSGLSTDGNVPTIQEEKVKLTPDRQVIKCGQPDATDGVIDTPGSLHELQQSNSGNSTKQCVVVIESVKLDLSVSKATAPQTISLNSVKEYGDISGSTKPGSQQTSPAILMQDLPLGPPTSSSSPNEKDAYHTQDGIKDVEAVSSTISLESLPQEGLSLPEAIYVLTRTNEDDSSNTVNDPSSSTGCIAVSKVSSTTEEMVLPEKYTDLTFTPKKNFSPAKSLESNAEPSSSVPLLHDEDSMMHTLSNLKRIPDAISPLRSPIRITKRSHLHLHSKPGHVKSLQKEFSGTATDANSKKVDVNKENKYPGSPVKHGTQDLAEKLSDLPSSLSDTELEEGEILSETDEPTSISTTTKRDKLMPSVRKKHISNSVFKRKTEERCVASTEMAEKYVGSSQSPASGKSRFKTVCPASSKASFSTVEEVMETFKLVRSEIRKKYMKLHKTFPKKSFYGVMENFRESFLEFVDGAHFGHVCCQAGELKSKLKALIESVFSKVVNNGIVKRIFEQQAVDLKQKLWDFVDVQVDYLFKDIFVTLKNFCRPARVKPEDTRSSGNEKECGLPPAKIQCQQKDTKSPPSNLNRIKTCAVAPYKTGLGSRGKDIRMTHVEKDSDNLKTQNFRNTESGVDFPSPKKPSPPEKSNIASLMVSQSSSLLDKTDFELLTEQQASSLTFNLVRDSQMGEIFKCLLQGSDLLESSGIAGETTAWSLGTPKKDGERLISITTPTKYGSPSKLLSPTKFDTPSKLFTTWSSISPRKMLSSPQSKDHGRMNPALFDESCMLEVPSQSQAMMQHSSSSQRAYSILAEDLAVSLTIPSPLKSDSHLSFLQPSSVRVMSTPDSVISAHISEDALLDGEDATEQDIHLALDTDNSSLGSNSSMASQASGKPFVFKPDLPVQALVMERSNDHFILKIRQSTLGTDVTFTADTSLNQTLMEDDQQHGKDITSQESQAKSVLLDKFEKYTSSSRPISTEDCVTDVAEHSKLCQSGADFCLPDNDDLTLKKHKPENMPIQHDASKESFSEDSLILLASPSKTTPSKMNLHNIAQSSDFLSEQSSPATNREDVALVTDGRTSPLNHEGKNMPVQLPSPSKTILLNNSQAAESSGTNQSYQESHVSDSPREEMEVSESERSLTIADDLSSTAEKDKYCEKRQKRKKRQERTKSKRPRKEKEDRMEDMVSESKKNDSETSSSPLSLSPNSLSAMNVIRKKGTVVMAWTRDEDRAILIDLKTKGASRETFSELSEKLKKPSCQIAQRFYQLMKLFRKMDP
ncbi:CASP8-associated protein 2 [Aulostomus maculatus]